MKLFHIEAFFAYPSEPSEVGDCIKKAATRINSNYPVLNLRGWERLKVGGRFIIDTILESIDDSMLVCADLTGLNPNVLFEVGYAIAKNKRLWVTIQDKRTFKELYQRFDLISGIGYVQYSVPNQIEKAYKDSVPHNSLGQTLYDDRIAPSLRIRSKPHILHVRRLNHNQSSVATIRALAESPFPKVVDDPLEASGLSLTWYGQQVHESAGVLVHLVTPTGEAEILHNAKCSLVAGLAKGFEKEVLMLAEKGFLAPIDYRELMCQYGDARQAETEVRSWIKRIESTVDSGTASPVGEDADVLHALAGFNIGQYVAENEPENFVDDYFVETSSYREALNAQSSVYVGRKGIGKSANLLKISSELSKRPKHLVCTIKPPAYEMEGLVKLLKGYSAKDRKSFAIESLWKFLIVSEVACSTALHLEKRATESGSGYSSEEEDLLRLVQENDGLLLEEFSVRLERAVEILQKEQGGRVSAGVAEERAGISEALHKGFLNRMRPILANVLSKYSRVAILIDNLDQAWDDDTDIRDLCSFVLGLLNVGPRLAAEFHNDRKLPAVPMTITVFLRADIFHQITRVATEPDKIQHTRIRWTSPELLLRVIEDRYAASFPQEDGANIWRRHFCNAVDGIPTRDFILGRILPRPRDIVFFTQAAIESAVNRKSDIVEEADVLNAERRYSKYALDSVLVEAAVSTIPMDSVIYALYGCAATMTRTELEEVLAEAHVPSTDVDTCINELINMSLIGIEVNDGEFRFLDEPEDFTKLERLGMKYAKRQAASVRYQVNRPFWPYLEVVE